MANASKLCDVTVIVTAHAEGDLIHRTLRNVDVLTARASEHGVTTEVLIICDRPSEETQQYFKRHSHSDKQLHMVDFGDPGLSRNAGISRASGKYITFLDGDDLCSRDWIVRAFQMAEAKSVECLFHPERTYVFGVEHAIIQHFSTFSPGFSRGQMMDNPWVSLIFAQRSLFEKVPFRFCENGFGFEDELLMCDMIAAGVPICVVPQTCKFYRRRPGSWFNHHASGFVLPPTKLFQPLIIDQNPVSCSLSRDDAEDKSDSLKVSDSIPDPVEKHSYVSRFLNFLGFGKNTSRRWEKWFVDELRAIHTLDPEIFPGMRFRQAPFKIKHYDTIGKALSRLQQLGGPAPTHVFMVPWLKRGGADLVSLNYIKLVADQISEARIVVVATERETSEWAKRLPKSVRFVELHGLLADLPVEIGPKILATYLIQGETQFLHIIHSPLAYKMLEQFGVALESKMRIYSSNFCPEISHEGQYHGFSYEQLPRVLKHLTAIMSDNQTFLNDLSIRYGWDMAKFYNHYQPVPQANALQASMVPLYKPGDTLHVLWAGRLDRQKRPDLLTVIARLSQHLPIRFHAYGTSALRWDRAKLSTRGASNLMYRGGFDGFSSLPLQDYHLFLNTSQWDGMPNILLEAASYRMPILTSCVGGVSELISHLRSGLSVEPFDDVQAYVTLLSHIVKGEIDIAALATQAYQRVRDVHCWESFQRQVASVPGYLDPVRIQDNEC